MDDVLKYAVEHGMIDLSSVQEQIEMDKRKELLQKHPYRIWQGKDGRYRTYITDGGSKYGRKLIVKQSLEDIENFIEWYYKEQEYRRFKDIFKIVRDEKRKYVNDPQKRLSVENSIARMESNYRRFFDGTDFESIYIANIKKQDIEDICIYNLTRYSLKKKAFNSMVEIIRLVCKKAYEEYWITDNVYFRVDMRKFKDMFIDDVDIAERCYNKQEVNEFLEHIHEWQRKYPKYLVSYALEMQIIMGLRRGEIPPLRWEDIKDDCILISREQITLRNERPMRDVIVDHTKTWKARKYPLSDKIQAFLGRLREVHKKYYDSPYLFPADTATGVIGNSTVYKFYRRSMKRLNIEQIDGVTRGTHAFRRNAITDVTNATGGNLEMASRLFGNTPIVAKQNYYTGLDMEKALEVLNTL